MMKLLSILFLISAPTAIVGFSVSPNSNTDRRTFLTNLVTNTATAGVILTNSPLIVNAAAPVKKEDLVSDLIASKSKMELIPSLLQQQEWDKVRTILKTPPVNQLWNLGESKNPLVKLAKETGEFELLELKDELAISLQMCDQLTYDNAFVYFQPGNGKVKIKEPTDLAKKAIGQIGDAITLSQ
eukprot:CAMPEP_0113936774 /NCGR_PEP_ID=MMETSP1339-20121228/3576_1 /TAXON_ID=94617 /ORGANISM="Fibrocapsa japonica" /LENGTH=183 /DNA_ID=CAMNT_0000939325 /DNA_START=49 /DNA_END=600 /DNA_ORIENTATION=- /assembly_acc=CAM_ASM_000762